MRTLFHVTLTVIALLGTILLVLPLLPAPIAGCFIFVSLCAVPIVLLQLLVCLLLWIKTKSPWRWVFAALLVGNIGVIKNHVRIPSGKGQACTNIHPSGTTLISHNVTNYHIHPDTLRRSAAYLRSLAPDIICLQERPHDKLLRWDSIRAAFPEYPYTRRNEEREDEVLNLAILSKYPLSDVQETYFPNTYNKAMAVTVDSPQGPFRLWNIHLQTTAHHFTRFIDNAQQRNAQADLIREQLQQTQLPTLVCGDFNDTPCSYAYRTLAAGMQDAFREASPTWTGTFQPMGRWLRIDYILCSPHWTVTDYRLLENSWSDHKIQYVKL